MYELKALRAPGTCRPPDSCRDLGSRNPSREITVWADDLNRHFSSLFFRAIIRLRVFFLDHRWIFPIRPLSGLRSRSWDCISNPSRDPKAAFKQGTLSGHWEQSGATSRRPFSPKGKTVRKIPKQDFSSTQSLPLKNTVHRVWSRPEAGKGMRSYLFDIGNNFNAYTISVLFNKAQTH